jgi:hypothetical protein
MGFRILLIWCQALFGSSCSSVNGTISFSDSDLHDVQLPHNDPLVITLRIGNYDVKRVLVDQGSFAEVMYQELYEKVGLGKSDLSEFSSPVFGFSGESTIPLGKQLSRCWRDQSTFKRSS